MPPIDLIANRFTDRWARLILRRLKRRPLIGPLLAASVFGLLAAMVADAGPGFGLATAVAPLGLIGWWCSHLRRGFIARLVVGGVGVFLVAAWAIVAGGASPEFPMVATVFAGYAAAVAAAGAGVRLAAKLIEGQQEGRTPEVRFTIGSLLVALTVVAVLSALLRFAQLPEAVGSKFVPAFGCFALIALGCGLVSRWVRRPLAAAACVAAVSVVAAFCFVRVSGAPSGQSWLMMWQGLLVGGWLLGARVKKRRRAADRAPPATPLPAPGDWLHDEPPPRAKPEGIDATV